MESVRSPRESIFASSPITFSHVWRTSFRFGSLYLLLGFNFSPFSFVDGFSADSEPNINQTPVDDAHQNFASTSSWVEFVWGCSIEGFRCCCIAQHFKLILGSLGYSFKPQPLNWDGKLFRENPNWNCFHRNSFSQSVPTWIIYENSWVENSVRLQFS